jgi:carbon monoxide dehydrogenase subunit G
MPTVTSSIEIPASAEQVWAVAADLSRYGEWNVAHTDFPDGTPQLAPDAKFREKISVMGMPGEATWTVTAVEEPSRIVFDGTGPMGITLGTSLELTAENGGTKVTLGTKFEGGPLAGPLGDSLAKSAQQAAEQSLGKLRDLVA